MFKKGKRWLKDRLEASGRVLNSAAKPSRWIRRTAGWLNAHKKQICIAAAGVVGAAGIAFTVSLSHQQYMQAHMYEVYHVYVGDQKVGVVSEPEIVQDYLEDIKEQAAEKYPGVHIVLQSDEITYKSEKGYNLKADNDDVLEDLQRLVEPKAAGVEVRVDGELIGIVRDKETAESILARIESQYVPDEEPPVSVLSSSGTSSKQGKSSLESVEFVEEVELKEIDTDPGDIMDEGEVLEKLQTGDVTPTKYVVQKGDCVSCIADKLDIPEEVIYENNPWVEDRYLQIGDELDLTVLQPVLSVKTVEKVQEFETVDYETEYREDDNLRLGKTVVIRPGKEGQKMVTYHLVKINGNLVEKEMVNEQIMVEPVTAIVKKGTKVIRGVGTGTFAWPVRSPRITSGYGMRWGSLHKGIDMVSGNRNIYAADNGKVEYAGYSKGYGYHVIIDHQNGYETLYAHMSKISVKKGATVEKGEILGRMGSTGHSTGVHLHFEVHKNGRVQNPSNYLN